MSEYRHRLGCDCFACNVNRRRDAPPAPAAKKPKTPAG